EADLPSFLEDMVPFDYLLWAARVTGRIRNERPLAFAMPPLQFSRLTPELVATGDYIALSAPLYRAGEMMGHHHLLNTTVAEKLLSEVSLSWVLDRISFGKSGADLSEVLPDIDEEMLQMVRGLVDLYVAPLPLAAQVHASQLDESVSHHETESEEPL